MIKSFLTVKEAYLSYIKEKKLQQDPFQLDVISSYDSILEALIKNEKNKSNFLKFSFFKKKNNRIRGLYVYGAVGQGKTMLMDLFFDLVPIEKKIRTHFNDFMVDVHNRIARNREAFAQNKNTEKDSISAVADEIARAFKLICFDEFSITDIADAMILGRLFSMLFDKGVVLVATSNVEPENLYCNGLNRGLFLPFIKLLQQHETTVCLNSDTDYRLKHKRTSPVYFYPLDSKSTQQMDFYWSKVTGHQVYCTKIFKIRGREILLKKTVDKCVRFDFDELCRDSLSGEDYLFLNGYYDTFFLDNVPVFDTEHRNNAKRFIVLIDVLYDARKRLFISAQALPHNLYIGHCGTEEFEFKRTASRLVEMKSEKYSKEWEKKYLNLKIR